MHVDEEQLQRLVDDGLGEPTDEWAREHVAHCESCREKLARAKADQDEVFALLGNLDHPRPRADHAAVIARARAVKSSWMGKAAGFVVAAALAGAAYAAPGSPLPSLVARVFGGGVSAPVAPVVRKAVPETPVSGVTVATGNRMIIVFTSSQRVGQISVTLSDAQEIEVRAVGAGASFTAGEQVLTVDNANSGADFAITIPRRAPLVEIHVGGDRVFLKDGARISSDNNPTGVDTWVIPIQPKR